MSAIATAEAEREAARKLFNMLYQDSRGFFYLRTKARGLVRVERCMEEVNQRRDELIGKDFRFTFPGKREASV